MALTAPTNDLTGNTIASTYDQLLIIDHADGIVEATLGTVSTQIGKSALQLSDEHVLIHGVDNNNAAVFEIQDKDDTSILKIAADTPAATLIGTLTVGTAGAGKDVIFHSGTSGDNFTWDASEECLIITGTDAAQALKVADGDLVVVDKIYLFDNDGGEYISGTGTDLTITSGNDIVLAVGSAGSVYSSGDGGTSNTIYGEDAGVALVSGGNYNVLFGYNAGAGITTGDENVVIGYSAGDSFDTESQNVLIGSGAGGNASFAANSCVAIGAGTLEGAATQDGSVAVGKNALNALTTGTGNLAIGYQAMDALTVGDHNLAIGVAAMGGLSITDVSDNNIAIGAYAMDGVTDLAATENVFIGVHSGGGSWTGTLSEKNVGVGNYTMTGAMNGADQNTAIGYNALNALTLGDLNVAVGESAGLVFTTGYGNVFLGKDAGKATVDSDKCTILGYNAASSGNMAAGAGDGSGADGTVAVGNAALLNLTSGSGNTAVGFECLDAAVTSDYNTAVGYQSLSAVNSDDVGDNTAVGYQAGLAATSAVNSVLIGSGAGVALTASNDCIAIGYQALDGATSGNHSNVAIGKSSMGGSWSSAGVESCVAVGNATMVGVLTSTAVGSVAVGYSALNALTSGATNTAVGFTTGALLTDGANNTFVGYQAGDETHISANNNTAVGAGAFGGTHTGSASFANDAFGVNALGSGAMNGSSHNVALGAGTLGAVTNGTSNVGVGHAAGDYITTGDQNVCIGHAADVDDVDAQCRIVIGYNFNGTADNAVHFGNNTSHIRCDFNADQTWDASSDRRQKKDIKESELGLDFIKDLKPSKYRYKSPSEFPEEWKAHNPEDKSPMGGSDKYYYGFIAQDVKEAIDKHDASDYGVWNSDTDGRQRVSREQFVVSLVKAVQELSAKVEELEAKLK